MAYSAALKAKRKPNDKKFNTFSKCNERALEELMPWEGAVEDPKKNKWLEVVRRLNVMSLSLIHI